MTIVFIPTLLALLIVEEREAGRPLTQQEVEGIRDNAVAISLPDEIANVMDDNRGYPDIAPDNVWEEWKVYNKDIEV
ncbi:hypothetical protein [Serratia fonticola]|uniref:Uncharacterized protein n=1 Tax=Serratia fonticola TaxID=47917 RepID=A0AAW3WP26_SERFO|nr:hypothetical protein [Serratia fonticola]MBC3212713.1 hypothetical protein [Serratia fonticola]NYA11281.1 hypothetical protein [Serratia fonticola]NYA31185.1 hypothetical protein [Serratia fonticola]